jgi:cullin-4
MKRALQCKRFQPSALQNRLTENKVDEILENATRRLQNDQTVSATYETLYSYIADLLNPGYARNLCQRLEILTDEHTRNVLDKFKQNDYEQIHFLNEMNSTWKSFCRHLSMIRGIYLFLDRKFVLSDTTVMSIWDLGIDKFKNYFLSNTVVQKRTVSEILTLIERERRGGVMERVLIKDTLGMLSSLSLYRLLFEPKFFDETRHLYMVESQNNITNLDVPSYLVYVKRIINEESDRAVMYLEKITHMPLIAIVEKELIANHLTTILTKGLDHLLDDLRMDDLKLLFDLCKRVEGGLLELVTYFNKHVKERGLVIVTNVDRDKTMVQDLLEFKERMDRVVEECFQKEEKFIYALKEAFENSINRRPNRPAELIAKYIDSKLKSGNKEASEDELEKMLDKILVLFRFIHGKDVFEAFYKKDLAKRLLVNKSASVDAEKSMLSRLKQECGAAFTSKLEGMFRDIETSRDMMTQFKNYMQSQRIESPIDMHVYVLTMGFWPTYQPVEVNLPYQLKKHQLAFQTFYTAKHSGRKLQWQPNLDHCSLIATYPSDKKHEFILSLFQALVLLLFNEKDEYTYEEILDAVKIDAVELNRTLQSLTIGKVRVLAKDPKGKDIMNGDKFIYIHNFKCQLYKIKINQIQLKETQEEQSMTEERVFQDRQYQIDAAIVRIMKTRKKLSHNNLAAEVFEHLRFPVRGHDLKVRIESLIERDYLHRSQENPNEYNYVA